MTQPTAARSDAWAFLWGKRHWRRQGIDLPVEVDCGVAAFPARAVNASAGGVLLRIAAEEIAPALAAHEPVGFGEIHDLLQPAFALRFGEGRIVRSTEVVRMAWEPDEPGALYAGCRFRAPLSAREARRLGLQERVCTAEDGILAVPSQEMTWQACDGCEAWIEMSRESEPEVHHEGTLVARENAVLAARIGAADPTRVVADLAQEHLRVQVIDHGRPIWQEGAWLLAVRLFDDSPGAPLEIVVRADRSPGRAVRHLFRPRAVASSA